MFKTTFKPIAKATLYKVDGYTIDGAVNLADPVEVGISPVYLRSGIQQTSIRTDKSGTQSHAEESVSDARILMSPNEDLDYGDIMEVFGLKYRINIIFPRYEMTGDLNHLQVDLIKWAG